MSKPIMLCQNKEFRTLYYHGRAQVHPAMIVYVRRNRLGCVRLGITTGKKLGGAVQRNRCRRLIREAYRQALPRLNGGWDIVIVARTRMLSLNGSAVTRILDELLCRSGLLTAPVPTPERPA